MFTIISPRSGSPPPLPFTKPETTTSKESPIQIPQYEPPKTGFLSLLPDSVVPYAQLMRIEKPHGYLTFLFPHLYGLLWASIALRSANDHDASLSTWGSQAVDMYTMLRLLYPVVLFVVGSICLRGAACSWNDTIDAPCDRLVARCCHRPVARGAVSTSEAHAFTLLLSVVGLSILAQLPNPVICTVYAVPLVVLIGLYPWGKQFTYYPQVLLGIALACGQLVGAAAAIGAISESDVGQINILGALSHGSNTIEIGGAILCFYGSNVLSAVIVDTVYAHQDLEDDIKAGVKSTAVLWQEQTRLILGFLSVVEVALLGAAGWLLKLRAPYYGVSVAGTAVTLAFMTLTVDLQDSVNCGEWFRESILWTGLVLIVGLSGEFLHLHIDISVLNG